MAELKSGNPIRNARRSSLLTQKQLADLMNMTTPTVVSMEKQPENCSIQRIQEVYQNVGLDGKQMIKDWVNSFF